MEEPTNRELKIMLDNVLEKHEEKTRNITEALQRIEKTGNDTNEQARYTNGRVIKLEDAFANITKIIDRNDSDLNGNDGLVKWRERLWGIFKITSILLIPISAVLGWLFTLFIKDLKSQINEEVSNKVVQALEDNYTVDIRYEQ